MESGGGESGGGAALDQATFFRAVDNSNSTVVQGLLRDSKVDVNALNEDVSPLPPSLLPAHFSLLPAQARGPASRCLPPAGNSRVFFSCCPAELGRAPHQLIQLASCTRHGSKIRVLAVCNQVRNRVGARQRKGVAAGLWPAPAAGAGQRPSTAGPLCWTPLSCSVAGNFTPHFFIATAGA